ncbi:MAG TPA: RNA-binding domain-containing protein [Nitrososphaera sp.]|nr:RNA-binding domain-containing protein [Nitrososphaera sp.]
MSEQDSIKFSAAEINLVLHATEDEDRVLKAIEDVLQVQSKRFSSSYSEGHFKNRIVLQKAILSSHEAGSLARRVVSLLNSTDREHLSRLIHEYSDEKGNLYIRLDKQRICQGRVSLSESDAIRIRFKPVKRYKPSGAIQGYAGLFNLHLNV